MRDQTWLHLFASIGAAALAACASPEAGEKSAGADAIATSQEALDVIGVCNQDPRVNMHLVSLSVCAGARLFFDETFGASSVPAI
jgi:uncharacterized protein YggE